MKSVCFTGHRTVEMTVSLEKSLTDTLEILISNGITDFYAGGAYGWDIICELTVIEMRKRYPHIKSLSNNSPHTSCLHIFRHIASKFLDIRQYACEILIRSDKKSDCAICARPIVG